MSQPSLSVWFVCRLCRGSFGQVDAFIEHKKQKHFTQFQNITSIVFEERELGPLYSVINSDDHQLSDESNELPIKIEVNNEDPIIPFSTEIIDEPTFGLVEVKNELTTFKCEINPDNRNNFFGSEQPQQNPYVLLKRLTSKEIQSACDRDYSLEAFEQKNLADSSEPPNLLYYADSNINDRNEVEKTTDIEPTTSALHFCTERNLFECKLCSKQLESDAKLKIHVGICALYHEDRHRFCVICNRKFYDTKILKHHRLSFHGTEEEKLSLLKFKCHLCPKEYRQATSLKLHLESHKKKEHHVRTSDSKLLKCSYTNCGKEFPSNSKLQIHIANIHLGVKPFSCHFPNCNQTFPQRTSLEAHIRLHTGELPYKCTVNNCNKTFMFSSDRCAHLKTAHRN